MKKIAQFATAASTLLVSFSAVAAFSGTMTMGQIQTEIKTRLSQGSSLNLIANDARVAGIPGSVLAISMLGQGQDACRVVDALVRGGYDAKTAVNSAVASGSSYSSMFSCAVAAGADPTGLVAPTAAGGDGGGGTGAGGGFGTFGATPTATFGGGGGGSTTASRS